jgi:hypothetical protein
MLPSASVVKYDSIVGDVELTPELEINPFLLGINGSLINSKIVKSITIEIITPIISLVIYIIEKILVVIN